MAFFQSNLTVDNGADVTFTTPPLVLNYIVQDLTGWTCRMSVFANTNDQAPMLALTTAGSASGSVVSNGTAGTVTGTISNASLVSTLGPLTYQLFIDNVSPLVSVAVTNPGSGYTSAPTVTFSGGGGTGAVGVATVVNGLVTSVTLTDIGSGYTSVPAVGFTGGGGTLAAATAYTLTGPVSSALVTNQGSGYTSVPTVSITGGGGTGATAVAVVLGNKVVGVTITSGGYGYSSAPSIAFSGGGGSSAAATPSISAVLTYVLQTGQIFVNACLGSP